MCDDIRRTSPKKQVAFRPERLRPAGPRAGGLGFFGRGAASQRPQLGVITLQAPTELLWYFTAHETRIKDPKRLHISSKIFHRRVFTYDSGFPVPNEMAIF